MIFLNDIKIAPTIFPDGTSQVWKINNLNDLILISINGFIEIKWRFEIEGEFLHLAQLCDLIRSQPSSKNYQILLDLTYLPYGRQDKEVSNESTFALHTFAKLLNSLNFDRIKIRDPHSDQALKLIKKSHAYYFAFELISVFRNLNADVICYPDEGAMDRYKNIHQQEFIYATKERDPLTGFIKSIELNGSPAGRNILIVDDIIDGGMTFKLLARELYRHGATEVNLYATHGIFSQGVKTIKDSGIKRIFTAKGEVFENDNQITYRTL